MVPSPVEEEEPQVQQADAVPATFNHAHPATPIEVVVEEAVEQSSSEPPIVKTQVKRQYVPESLIQERARRQAIADEKRALELAARRVTAVLGAQSLATRSTDYSPAQPRPQQLPQRVRRVREYSVSAEELANGDRSIKRGGIRSSNSEEAESPVARRSVLREEAPQGLTTLISLNFDGMIPPNQCS